MAKINTWVTTCGYPTNSLNERVADATESLLKAIRMLDQLAAPKQFNMSCSTLRRFDSIPSDGIRHGIYCEGGGQFLDEIAEWGISGTIGNRPVEITVTSIFHTQENNRSGTGEFAINGNFKADYKPEYGGITLEDVWQKESVA